MTKKKDINRIAKATAKELLALVCQYYGIREIKQLAASAQLSSWRYFIYAEARQIACLVLQRHCESEPEDLQVALKELGLDWSSISIRMNAKMARRKLAEDHMFRISMETIEHVISDALIGKSNKTRPRARLQWERADYITANKQGKTNKKGMTK